MQTGDNGQDPRPGENDDETSGPETATQSRGKNWAYKYTARTADDPDDLDEADDDPRVGPPPSP
jgi:hypothetical protein